VVFSAGGAYARLLHAVHALNAASAKIPNQAGPSSQLIDQERFRNFQRRKRLTWNPGASENWRSSENLLILERARVKTRRRVHISRAAGALATMGRGCSTLFSSFHADSRAGLRGR